MTDEIWLPISGFEGFYEVSNLGRVRALPRESYFTRYGVAIVRRHKGRILKPGVVSGYLQVAIYKNPVRTQRKVHQIVLDAFVGPCPDGQEGRHKNGKRDDCRLENLAWGTKLENAADKRQHGTMSEGERHPSAKVTAKDVVDIRNAKGRLTQERLATEYGVGQSTIRSIQARRTWKHVPCA